MFSGNLEISQIDKLVKLIPINAYKYLYFITNSNMF